jgi:recombination protein RecT
MSKELAQRPIDTLSMTLRTPKMQQWLEKQVHASLNRNATQMINIALQAASQNEMLAKCTPTSVLANLCLCAQIGLVPNTALGHAYLVPFNNRREVARGDWRTITEATLVIGYKGYVKLVHDAANLVVQAQPVYAGDEFDYDLAAFPPVKHHRPGSSARTDDKLTHAWCLLRTTGGQIFGEVMTKDEILRRRDSSKGYIGKDGNPRKDSPWLAHPAEMWRKTAVRHALKLAPTGNDERLERALSAEDESRDNAADIIDMSDAPQELRDADQRVIESSSTQGASIDAAELDRIRCEFQTCDTINGLDEVAGKLPKHIRDSMSRDYATNADRIRGGR